MISFNLWLENQTRKVLYINRGISGSGKSTLAKSLVGNGVIFSTDDFFHDENNKYKFNHSKLGLYHKANQERTEKAMRSGITPIVIDNTNIQFFEMKPYVRMAQQYGYEVEFHEPNTPWKFDAEELTKRNTHGVGRDVIDRMLQRYQHNPTPEEILNSKAPWEK